jgi:hypothetical protein
VASSSEAQGRIARIALLVDHAAKDIALRRWVLPECIVFPVAAADEAAIGDYVGAMEQVLSGGSSRKALLVTIAEVDFTITRGLSFRYRHREKGYSSLLGAAINRWVRFAISQIGQK